MAALVACAALFFIGRVEPALHAQDPGPIVAVGGETIGDGQIAEVGDLLARRSWGTDDAIEARVCFMFELHTAAERDEGDP